MIAKTAVCLSILLLLGTSAYGYQLTPKKTAHDRVYAKADKKSSYPIKSRRDRHKRQKTVKGRITVEVTVTSDGFLKDRNGMIYIPLSKLTVMSDVQPKPMLGTVDLSTDNKSPSDWAATSNPFEKNKIFTNKGNKNPSEFWEELEVPGPNKLSTIPTTRVYIVNSTTQNLRFFLGDSNTTWNDFSYILEAGVGREFIRQPFIKIDNGSNKPPTIKPLNNPGRRYILFLNRNPVSWDVQWLKLQ